MRRIEEREVEKFFDALSRPPVNSIKYIVLLNLRSQMEGGLSAKKAREVLAKEVERASSRGGLQNTDSLGEAIMIATDGGNFSFGEAKTFVLYVIQKVSHREDVRRRAIAKLTPEEVGVLGLG